MLPVSKGRSLLMGKYTVIIYFVYHDGGSNTASDFEALCFLVIIYMSMSFNGTLTVSKANRS